MSNVVINVSPKPIRAASASAGKRPWPFYLFSYRFLFHPEPALKSTLLKSTAFNVIVKHQDGDGALWEIPFIFRNIIFMQFLYTTNYMLKIFLLLLTFITGKMFVIWLSNEISK